MTGNFGKGVQFPASGEYSIKELIDIEKFRGVLEKFSQATGFTTGLFSHPKQELLIATGWQDICSKFHRIVPSSEEQCIQSNQKLASQLKNEKTTCIQGCKHGLKDGATPIIIQGVHMASLFTGQVFFEKPDMDWFRKQAEQYGYDTDAYLEALAKVPIVTEDALKGALEFLAEIAVLCAEQGMAEIQKREKTAALKVSELLYRTTIDSLGEAVHLVDRELNVIMMNKKFKQWSEKLGYGSDVLGKPLREVFPFLSEEMLAQYGQVFETGKGCMEQEKIDLAGQTIMAETHKIPVLPGEEVQSVLTMVCDITEQKQNEVRLRESRANLTALIESTDDIIAAYDTDIRLITFNSACRKIYKLLFGVNLQVGMRTLELFPESTHEYWKMTNARALNGERFADEFIIDIPGQGERIFESSYYPIYSESQITGFATFTRDITERKQVEEVLRKSEQKMRTLLESSPDFIMVLDSDATIQYINHTRPEHNTEDVVGKTVYEFQSPECHDEFKNLFEDVVHTGQVHEVEIRALFNGEFVFFENRLVPMENKGKVDSVLLISRDITERKQAEEVLREEKDRAQMYLDHAGSLLLFLDSEGKVCLINRKGYETLEYPEEEIIGKNWLDNFVPESYREELQSIFQQVVAEEIEPPDYIESIAVTKSGNERVFAWHKTQVIFEDGKVSGVFCSGEDITERKKIEEERLSHQRHKLTEKTQSLSRMAGSVAHHFNNMLAAMMGNLEMVKMEFPDITNCMEYLDEAMKAAQRATEMSGFMLAYTGQVHRKSEPLDLSAICDGLIPKIREMKPDHVRLVTGFTSSGPFINADRVQVEQMLTHLVTNAWEAIGDDDGEIRISVRTLPLEQTLQSQIWPPDWKPETEYLAVLQVTDTGCGICAEDLDKVMDPFFSTKFTGRGLGLAIVLGTIQSHKGAVVVKSEEGAGTTFQVLFSLAEQPIKAVQEPEQEQDTVALPQMGDTILLVEDEKIIRKVAEVMLKHLGFDVLIADNGVQAIEMFREQKDEICLVISDLTMPHMSGWETLKALRALQPDIPVILASGYDEARVMAYENDEKPDVFLHKPYRLNILKDALKTALGSLHPLAKNFDNNT